eukprot:CAMPEP_0172175470 /NCGR_PEP_ID=MMETSP1050-20130122/14248_1 /TAXON_ID=233186 /ORGANISM="Cryptomonas curvata, Strain CCAP979/52" /LENGTH=121 /DNA_ID=CAMNT_0012847581 /DNA_START=96 /DNA_END=462 /DNA_ORIENTATION=+
MLGNFKSKVMFETKDSDGIGESTMLQLWTHPSQRKFFELLGGLFHFKKDSSAYTSSDATATPAAAAGGAGGAAAVTPVRRATLQLSDDDEPSELLGQGQAEANVTESPVLPMETLPSTGRA